jgi:hypothetical protein
MATIAGAAQPVVADGPLPQPLPLTAEILAEIVMPAEWRNPPSYAFRPKHGSYGVAPLDLNAQTVTATSAAGGFPESNSPVGNPNYTPVEHLNIVRLATVVWGANCKPAIADLLGGGLEDSLDDNINSLVGGRFAATDANPMYHMVQEEVEIYNTEVRIKTFARISVRARLRMAGEDLAAVAHRERVARSYRAAAFDLRDRALEAINEAVSRVSRKYTGKRGQVLVSRLRAVRTKFAVDPFVRLNPNQVSLVYFRLDRDAKKQFWLNRFNKNVVAWFWEFCGIMDIRETISDHLFSNYCREEFAFVCDAMWYSVISINVEGANFVQSGSVAERAANVHFVAAIDQLNYRQHIGTFNENYNRLHPRRQVRSLAVISVLQESISKPKGLKNWVCTRYAAAVERDMADEESI